MRKYGITKSTKINNIDCCVPHTIAELVKLDDSGHGLQTGHGNVGEEHVIPVRGHFHKTGTVPGRRLVGRFRFVQKFLQIDQFAADLCEAGQKNASIVN